jgi:hypothetical protein
VLAVLAVLFIAKLSDAQDIIGGAKPPVAEVNEAPELASRSIFETADLALKISRLETRIAELEETQLDEADVRRIAEDVFRKMSLTVGLPGGGQRSAIVNATSGNASIQLAPGEVLMGYTDPVSGQYVRVQQQATSGTIYRTASSGDVVVQQVGSTATVRRPLLRATGRVLSAPFRAAAAGTCRIVNGRQVCN